LVSTGIKQGAVDTVNNENNKTLEEVKGLIKEALTQANKIGVDDTTKVSVSNGIKSGDDYTYHITKGTVTVAKDLDFNLHVGADADLTNKIGVGIAVMDSKYLGVQDLQVVDDTGNLATYAIDAIEDAITKVNEQRSALGAVQNRLEHTIKNVDNVVENTTAAESQIRDTDMASEMVRYSNNNILMQAGQSMLAQANQSNQGVLSLLG
jgi:flagellin